MNKFFIVALSVFVAFHIISYWLLVRPMTSNANLGVKILGILGLCANLAIIVFFVGALRQSNLPSVLFTALSVSILIAVLLCAAALINGVFLLSSLAFKNLPTAKISQIIFCVAIVCVIWGIINAARMPKITEQTIALNNFTGELKILQIADLHLSALISQEKVAKIVALANSANADVIVLTGDIIDNPADKIAAKLAELQNLRAKYGIYFVLGNHEFINGANSAITQIRALGNITPLINESAVIDERVNLIGISDLSGYRAGYLEPDMRAATSNLAESLPRILLSHQPNIINSIDSSEKIDLVLSGHTHGGQIAPFSLVVYLANPFLYGLKNINGIQLYITQGASIAVTYGRVGSRAELNLITLQGEKL